MSKPKKNTPEPELSTYDEETKTYPVLISSMLIGAAVGFFAGGPLAFLLGIVVGYGTGFIITEIYPNIYPDTVSFVLNWIPESFRNVLQSENLEELRANTTLMVEVMLITFRSWFVSLFSKKQDTYFEMDDFPKDFESNNTWEDNRPTTNHQVVYPSLIKTTPQSSTPSENEQLTLVKTLFKK